MQEEVGLLTFCDGKVGNGLPPVHRYSPSALNTTTAEINDQLFGVATERGEHGLQAVEREGTGRE